jgi:hypothetical protein
MRIVYGNSVAGTRKADGQNLQAPRPSEQIQQNQIERPDRIVRPVTRINGARIHFRELALMAWPKKTEANLAFHTHYDPRTCRRWLADDTEPPADALGVVLAEIMQRFHQR